MEELKISVIVPTYNRVDLLRNQVMSLVNQTLRDEEYEIIVVNDGSVDATEQFLNSCTLFYHNVKFFNQKNGGPAKARNTAVRMARAEIIAFTDDDCEVASDWLETILKEFNGELVGLQGLTYTDRDDVTPLTHQIDNEAGHNSIPTCNAAYYKDLLLQIGGFDETFPYPHNEDADVGWQMQEIGEVKFCANMKVYHPPRLDKFKKVAKRMDILESEFTLYEKNPRLYKKYRDENPLKHIYNQVFLKTMWYNFYSKLKYWKRPKVMVQGFALTLIWWVALIKKYPKYKALYKEIKEKAIGGKQLRAELIRNAA